MSFLMTQNNGLPSAPRRVIYKDGDHCFCTESVAGGATAYIQQTSGAALAPVDDDIVTPYRTVFSCDFIVGRLVGVSPGLTLRIDTRPSNPLVAGWLPWRWFPALWNTSLRITRLVCPAASIRLAVVNASASDNITLDGYFRIEAF